MRWSTARPSDAREKEQDLGWNIRMGQYTPEVKQPAYRYLLDMNLIRFIYCRKRLYCQISQLGGKEDGG